jgi:hypothetical protein
MLEDIPYLDTDVSVACVTILTTLDPHSGKVAPVRFRTRL